MNSRTLLVIAYAFLLTLGIQYFYSGQTPSGTPENQWIILQVTKATTVLPNIPQVSLINKSMSGVSIDMCRDLKIMVDSKILTDLSSFPGYCQTINGEPQSTLHLPLWALAPLFARKVGEYTFELNTPVGTRITHVTHEAPGAFRQALTALFYEPIYNLFIALIHFLPGHTLWWAIIVITLIIRLLLLVPQHHMLESQKKLQLIQPKIKALQEKYKDNQAELGSEMLELYKKEGVNPMGSCLPLVIQMPILIGLYWVITGVNDPANAYHLYSILSNFTNAEITTMFYGVDLHSVGGSLGIIAAILLVGIQYLQARLSFHYNPPKKKEKHHEKKEGEENDKLGELALDPDAMKYMMLYVFPLVIGVTAFFFPLGVALYWYIGTVFVIGQQWYVNRKK